MGEFAARNMIKKRSKLRWSSKSGKKKLRKLKRKIKSKKLFFIALITFLVGLRIK